jgi:predicted ATPase/DNA-binding SARP family transcriptional activator
MAAHSLTLLGPPRLLTADGAVVPVRARKEWALLAYLAAEHARPQQRDTLLALLWPEASEEAARRSLRVALVHLRVALAASGVATLAADHHTVQLHPHRDHWLDVAAFAALLAACRAHRHARADRCALCNERLTQATALYGGEFLSGLTLPDAAPFEEWAVVRREELHRQVLDALATLAAAHEQAGDDAALCRDARRQLALEPWHEPAHRQFMRGLARSGDRGAALAQYETCRRVLAEELGVEPDVETRALYERIRAGDLTPATRAAPRHHLPASLTPLVGREAELAALAALLRQEEVRLLTILGAGGMGKTRLALELARAGLDGYADGVFFVALAPLAAAGALASTIAQALDLPVQGHDPTAALLRFVRDKHLLLILDNFEHLLDGVGLVVQIVEAAPRVQIIATSREPLHMRGEQLYVVEGLAYAASAPAADATALPADEATLPAVRLFVQSARRAQASFAPDPATLPALLRICGLVQGMPLGLELAAAWTGLLPLEEIAAEIARSADFLAADWHDVPSRQRSMRAVFDWSWALLTEAERQALRRLSVFRGGCTRQAADTVAGATLTLLTGLVHKSLLRRTDAGATSVGRYEVHELLRQFAAEQLDGVPAERDAVQARHSAYYLDFVAARAGRLARDEPRAAAAEIRGELDNVRQAWQWAAEQAAVAGLEQAAFGWWQFCLLNGLEREGRELFGLAAERIGLALERLGPEHPERRQYERGLSLLLALHANHLFGQGPYELMAAQAREAMRLGAASGGVEGETFGAYVLGRAMQELGKPREARLQWERTIELARRYQPHHASSEMLREAEWVAYLWLCGNLLFFEDYAGGRAYVLEALRLCQTLRKRRGEMICLGNLAPVDFYTGDDMAARQRYEQVLTLARALDDRWYEQRVQWEVSEVLRVQGQYVQARTLLIEVATAAQEIGDWYAAIQTLAALVRVHCQLGDGEGAGAWRDQLLALLGKEGITPDCQAAGFRACALYALHTGDHQQALADAEHGMHLSEQYDSPFFRAETAVILGHVRAGMEHLAAAATAYQQALTWYAVCGNQPLATEPRAGLAQLALAQGDGVGAQALAEPLLPLLADQPRTSVLTPFYVYLVCYRVLAANHDPRAAAVLQTAQQRLRSAADTIEDTALRQMFLEQVATHRELLLDEAIALVLDGRDEAPAGT